MRVEIIATGEVAKVVGPPVPSGNILLQLASSGLLRVVPIAELKPEGCQCTWVHVADDDGYRRTAAVPGCPAHGRMAEARTEEGGAGGDRAAAAPDADTLEHAAAQPGNHAALVDASGDTWVRVDEHPGRYGSWWPITDGPGWEEWGRDKVGTARDWDDLAEYGPFTEADPQRAAAAVTRICDERAEQAPDGQAAPAAAASGNHTTSSSRENTVNLEAVGPEEIRAGFTTAIDTATERAEEIGGIGGALVEAADRYESLQMAASTVGHVRDAAEAFNAAHASLNTATEELQAALSDFNTHDGAVADTVADTGGNVADRDVLVG